MWVQQNLMMLPFKTRHNFSFNALQLVQDKICLARAQVSPIPGGGVNCVRKRPVWDSRGVHYWNTPKHFFIRHECLLEDRLHFPFERLLLRWADVMAWKLIVFPREWGRRVFVVCLPALLELRNPQSGRLKKVSVPCLVFGGEKQWVGCSRKQWDGKLLKNI